MAAGEKPLKKKKSEEKPEKEKPRRKLSDDAYHMGCWICSGQHRRDTCDSNRSNMLCDMFGKEKNHISAICLQQFAVNNVTPTVSADLFVKQTARQRE